MESASSSHLSHQKPIYDYLEVSDLLNDLLIQRKQKNPRDSVRGWARQLGFKSPSLLLNILKGERKLSPELAEKLAVNLHFSKEERAYYEALVLAGCSRSENERKFYSSLLLDLTPSPNRVDLKLAHFKLISEWYHLSILEMLSLTDFKEDPEYLSKRLRRKVSPEQVTVAVERLRQLGLLARENGKLKKAKGNPVLKGEIPSEAIRNHHREMMARAKSALREQSLTERDFRVTKLAMKKADYDKAKEIILRCHRALQRLSVGKGGDDVYAFNTQFFKLTGEVKE